MTKKDSGLLVLIAVGIICAIIAVKLFPIAHPLLGQKNMAAKSQILQAAEEVVNSNDWNIEGYERGYTFTVEDYARAYVQMNKGGKGKFRELLDHTCYSPYYWEVKYFKPQSEKYVSIYLRPDASFYGFRINPDKYNVSVDDQKLLDVCHRYLKDRYDIEVTSVLEPEISALDNETIKAVKLRYEIDGKSELSGLYKFEFNGDKLIAFTNSLDIPEDFKKQYNTEIENNNDIAIVSLIFGMLILFGFGVIISLIALFKTGWLIWKQPLYISLVIAFLITFAELNKFPVTLLSNSWVEEGLKAFYIVLVVDSIIGSVIIFVFLFLSIMMAESLTRKAFPGHIQLWRLGRSNVISSLPVMKRWIIGVSLVPIYFALYHSLSLLFTSKLGWYIPSEIEQDFLAFKFPWFSSALLALFTGVMEETFFRAIPIAGAALIGDRLGKRNTFIVIGIIVQTVIFTLMHANHPQIPFYGRLLAEVVLTSIVLGIVYVRYGLLPGIIFHSTTNLIWASMPMLIPSLSGIWPQRLILVIIALIPLAYIILLKIRCSGWQQLKESDYNRAWIISNGQNEKV